MLKFFRNILNTYKSKKLSDFMRNNSIKFHDNSDLNIAKEKFTNYVKFNINARDFIVEYSKKDKLYKIVQNVKNILDSDSGQMANGEIKSTYYHKIYPYARETGSTQKGAVDALRENIDKIDKYVSECERLKLEVGTCID